MRQVATTMRQVATTMRQVATAIVGDDRPVPVAQRPEWQRALAQGCEPDMLAFLT